MTTATTCPPPTPPRVGGPTPETWEHLDRVLTGHAETAHHAARALCHATAGLPVLPATHTRDVLTGLSRTTRAVAEACTHLGRALAGSAAHPDLTLVPAPLPGLDEDEAGRQDRARSVTARAVGDLTAAADLARGSAAAIDLARSLIATHTYTPRAPIDDDP